MMKGTIALPLMLALAACHSNTPTAAGNSAASNTAAADQAAKPSLIWIQASDGKYIRGAFYKADKPKAMILLFHQAGSSKDEYATIAPKLTDAGYDALAIDQRSGGDMFGSNETVKRLGNTKDYGAVDVDLQGAVQWTRPFNLPVVLWGSSYSAALVFGVANTYPDLVKAVLAFSPGEYLSDPHQVTRAASEMKVPVFITAANTPDETAKAKAIAARVPNGLATVFIPDQGGAHGSSTLIAAKDPQGAAQTWDAVTAFLAKVVPGSRGA